MTPKEKADSLFVAFLQAIPDYVIKDNDIASGLAKQSAIITVDEVINSFYFSESEKDLISDIEYYSQVKTELLKL